MRSHGKTAMVFSLAVMCCFVLGWAQRAFSFAEEPIGFKDPRSQQVWEDHQVSTVHTDLVHALAIAAGFSDRDAGTIVIWDQLVDSIKLGPGKSVVYTNCLGSVPPAPDHGICEGPGGLERQVWPTGEYEDTSCATDRHGPYATNFHWLHQTDEEIGQVRLWARGEKDYMEGWAVYAWGGYSQSVLDATCQFKRRDFIDTGIKPGSLEAYATYVHMLADTYSHKDCLTAIGDLYPFVTHTQQKKDSAECPYCSACYYNPPVPHNGDAHGTEFGPEYHGNPSRAGVTYDSGRAVYNALRERSLEREGVYAPVELTDKLPAMGGITLDQAIYNFAFNWNFQVQEPGGDLGEFAQKRRAYAEQITAAVKQLRGEKLKHKKAGASTAGTSTPAIKMGGSFTVRYGTR